MTRRTYRARRTSRSSGGARAALDRRHFLQGAAAAALPMAFGCATSGAETSFVAPAVLAPPERAPRGDTLKVGLVGCGGRGTGAALNALRAENGTVVLHAVGDLFPDRVEKCLSSLATELTAAKIDPKTRVLVTPERTFYGFDAYKQVIDSGVDVVILTTPPVFRPASLAYAVEKQKHVFCEKPVAVDAPGVRSVLASVEAARAAKLALVSGLCWRHDVRQREIFQRVNAGQIGDVHAVYTTYNSGPNAYVKRAASASEMEHAIRNWYHFTWLGGDHVVEQAVHSIDKMAWFYGDVKPVSCVAVGGRSTPVDVGDRWDHFSATFDYGGGRKGFHMSRQWANCPFENNDYAFGTRGKATIRGWDPYQAIEGAEPWTCATPLNDMYQAEHDALFAAIRSGEALNEGVRMTHSTLLALMVRMAAYTGRVVTWDEALNSQETLGLPAYALGDLPPREAPIPGRTKFV